MVTTASPAARRLGGYTALAYRHRGGSLVETITFVQQIASPALDGLMLAVTNLAGEQAYLALLVIIYLGVDGGLGRRLGIVLMLSLLLNAHLKGVIDAPRPFVIDPSVARSDAAVATAEGAGFPSGHAQGSATFWGYLAQHVSRRWVRALACVLVALISLSRIYLGVHVPIDVVAGLAIAGVVLVVASVLHRHAARLVPRWPQPLLFLLGIVVPLVMHLVWPVPYSALLMGGLAAFLTAPALIHYDMPATVSRRTAVAALGLVMVFAAEIATSLVLPEAVETDALGAFVRSLALGYVGLALTPYLASARWAHGSARCQHDAHRGAGRNDPLEM